MKLNQDFLGTVNRLRSKTAEFNDRVEEVMSRWRDATASDFNERHLVSATTTLGRLMLTLQEAAELASRCDKAIREDE